RGKRRAHTDVVGYGDDVEPEILGSTAPVLPVSPFPRGEHVHAESELHARTLPTNRLRASAAKVGDPENHWKTTRPTRARLPTVRTVPDDLFSDPRLAALYDTFDDPRDDIPLYVGIADELRARRVLDVGCGTGEPAVALAATGREVVGVDPAKASLDIARSKSGDVTWLDGDAGTVSAHLPAFRADLAMMTGNVAQVFLTDEDW